MPVLDTYWLFQASYDNDLIKDKDVANMVKTAIVKHVPMNNDALLNIQAC